MNQTTRLFLSTCFVSVFVLVVLISSWGKEQSEAYYFPLVISFLSAGLGGVLWLRLIPRLKQVSFRFPAGRYKHFLMIFYIFLSVQVYEVVGFYSVGFFLFLTVALTFDHKKLGLKRISKTILIALVFMVIIYGLFALLLKVQTPGELF